MYVVFAGKMVALQCSVDRTNFSWRAVVFSSARDQDATDGRAQFWRRHRGLKRLPKNRALRFSVACTWTLDSAAPGAVQPGSTRPAKRSSSAACSTSRRTSRSSGSTSSSSASTSPPSYLSIAKPIVAVAGCSIWYIFTVIRVPSV